MITALCILVLLTALVATDEEAGVRPPH